MDIVFKNILNLSIFEQIFPQKTYSNLNKRSINLLNLLGLSTANQLQTIYDNENKVHTFNKILVSNEKFLNSSLQNLSKQRNRILEIFSEWKKIIKDLSA